MWSPDVVVAAVRAVRGDLVQLLPRREARIAAAELDAHLARAQVGEDVTAELLHTVRRWAPVRDAVFMQLRSERGPGDYQALLGVTFDAGARFACPVAGCAEVGDRLDDSEPEPRCPTHRIRMQRV
jgi:hypothetical protein